MLLNLLQLLIIFSKYLHEERNEPIKYKNRFISRISKTENGKILYYLGNDIKHGDLPEFRISQTKLRI